VLLFMVSPNIRDENTPIKTMHYQNGAKRIHQRMKRRVRRANTARGYRAYSKGLAT